ncbi:MAG: glycosyltransferase [Desulfurococcales archaeon]|nr:glycosyltransferase [Desulfurococcales archaeon]
MERVGFVSTYPPVHCGVGEYTRMLISGLKRVSPGIDVVVFQVRESKGFIDRELGVRVIPSFDRGSSDYSSLLEALEEVGGVDVIHVQHEYGIFGRTTAILDSLEEAKRRGLASLAIVTMHTTDRIGPRQSLEFQSQLNRVDAVVVHSVLQEFELQAQGIEPYKVWRIPHGTLINPYLDNPRHLLLDRLGLEDDVIDGFLLVTPGFIRRDKGLDILMNAVKHLKRRVRVLVAGEKSDAGLTLYETGELVVLEKYLSSEEILMLAALADAIVLPYKDRPGKYSVSGILHLSMGSLKPIIGTRVPRLIELYQYAPRLTVPPRAPILLAERINWLMENYDLAVAYSSNLLAYAARTQWPRIARRHIDLYKMLLAGEKPVWEPLVDARVE